VCPRSPNACTRTYRARRIGIVVSKLVLRTILATLSACGLAPLSTRHAATLVAPFQLAYTIVVRRLWAVATAGGSAESAPHANL
jgi:hypothetical protein